jgi:hypothetical protein
MEGDALVKQMTGAQVMAMAEDVPALRAMKPGGKEHPIDKVLRDGEQVTLGGVTLVAHLTAGHTRGCTTWTTTAQEGGRTYNVMIGCSLRPPATLTPEIINEFNRSLKTVRALPCDVQLGDHGAQYNMQEKLGSWRALKPLHRPRLCTLEPDVQESMFKAVLAEQRQAPRHLAVAFRRCPMSVSSLPWFWRSHSCQSWQGSDALHQSYTDALGTARLFRRCGDDTRVGAAVPADLPLAPKLVLTFDDGPGVRHLAS